MRISIFAIGKLKSGPESELMSRYLDRVSRTGPQIGLELQKHVEGTESRASKADDRKRDEAQQLFKSMPEQGKLIILDERGKSIDSTEFANMLAQMRDDGERNLTFAIGGADGHGDEVKNRAYKTLSFGKMTWPHQFARIMLAEQLYRSCTILSGHPYHRE